MSLFERRSELKELILTAMRNVIDRLESEHKKDIYALVFYPSDGYRDLHISYSTRSSLAALEKKAAGKELGLDPVLLEMLKGHPDLMEQALSYKVSKFYFEVTACEWEGVGAFSELFSEVNDIIDDGYDALYDEGIENGEICRFFASLLTEVLMEVKSMGMLKSPVFVDDVLMGVQFPDSSSAEIVAISKAVNSASWHEKLCAVYSRDS